MELSKKGKAYVRVVFNPRFQSEFQSWCTAILKSFASDGCLAAVEGNTEKIFQVSIEPSARYSLPFFTIYLQLGFFPWVLRFSPLFKNLYLITCNLRKFSLQCPQLAYP